MSMTHVHMSRRALQELTSGIVRGTETEREGLRVTLREGQKERAGGVGQKRQRGREGWDKEGREGTQRGRQRGREGCDKEAERDTEREAERHTEGGRVAQRGQRGTQREFGRTETDRSP